MPQLTIGEIAVEVVRKDIKNLHLGVYPPNGRVRIAAPMRIDDDAVRLFAISKLTWIKKQQVRFRQQERQAKREYVSGESHYYNGKRYILKVITAPPPSRVEIRGKKYIYLYVPAGSSREKRQQVMNQWYRNRLKEQIPGLLEEWQPITGVEVSSWGIKAMKTKWGSCNVREGRIWINLELAKKPTHCIRYILVHEMVHLLERRHNDRFIAYMDRYMPQWRKYKEELNRVILGHVDWN
ncbi:MAG: SprT family zinc-dependent metalloprotease [Candidatus Aminicenantes bacterium]|nr:SprT family zinc-dependent metalloprotease [Candidatus Aminicenantes bacterium]